MCSCNHCCSGKAISITYSECVCKLIEGADIVRFIKAQRVKWPGHIQRMDQARPTRKLLVWKPMGTRPVGKTRQ